MSLAADRSFGDSPDDASQEDRPNPIDQTVEADPPASKSKKRSQKKTEEKKVPSAGGAASGDGVVPVEGSSEGLAAKKKKKTKRSREDLEGSDDPTLDSAAEGLENEVLKERPKKKTTKKKTAKKARQSPGPGSDPAGTHQSPRKDDEVEVQRPPGRLPPEDAQMRTGSPGCPSKESIPPRISLSEGSLGNRPRIDFADRVEFLYNENTPLVCNPDQCAELSRQIRGGPREMPFVGDLVFKDGYIEASLANRRADGSINVLVEKYDIALKQTMTELGASVKLARVRFGVIERLRADQERTSKKTLEEKEALRVKFEGLEATLKADRAAKKELARERAILEKTNAELEKEKVELQAERDVVAQKLIEKRKRLRDSRGQEVSRERVRVQSAMTDKLSRRLDRSGENPADAAPSCKKADLHVGDETVEEGDSLVREDLPKDADSAKVIEVHDPSPDEEEENDDAEESPSPLLVETREPSREQKKSGLAEKSSSPVSIGQEKSREWNEGEEQAISTDVLESLTTPEGGEVAKDPEADLPTAPVEDPSAPKELPA
ncbi:hypothetical protein Bca52824_026717 [Brassica carinata]|uniref:Uncharacterized protein n=1 Tax=Brassica carinata TaxID=52824 RepID=A0A8X7SL85_BRACI|nr:hypothetical protein Bca52824_026717 [Brassica carinata]